LRKVLKAIGDAEDIPQTGIRRVEVNTFASGDATFNVYIVGEDEAVGGYLDNL